MRHWQPVRAIYKIASSTARKLVSRGRPNALRAGIEGSITAHSASVRSLAYRCPARSYFERVISVHMLYLGDCAIQPLCYNQLRSLNSFPVSLLVLLSHKIRDRVFIWIATARCSILAYLHPDRGAGMDGGSSEGSEARFAGYVEALGVVLGHADRQQPMHDYCLGLLMPIERKSVEPMAAVTAPAQVAAKHQSLLHFVGNASWSDAAMLARVGQLVLPAIERSGPIEAWIIDDTGFPKKGRHSVGVTRQYCGQLGKQDN